MRNVLRVAKAEYNRLVRRRSFLLATLGVPLFIALVSGAAIFIAMMSSEDADTRPIGYVDQANVLRSDITPEQYGGGPVALTAFAEEAAARSALEGGEIQAYWLLPPDYRDTGRVSLLYWQKSPSDAATDQFRRFLRTSLVAGLPEAARATALSGINVSIRTLDENKQATELNPIGVIMPLILGMAFVFIVMGSSGYLLQAVTTEKENRMVEVMFTTVSPLKLIAGKALGLMGVALTQMTVWGLAAAAALFILSRTVDFPAGLAVPPKLALVALLYFVPSYALVAGIMITIGAMVTETQQGQQIAGFVNLLFVMPFFFFAFVFTNPDSPVMVGLTLFPTTSFMAIAMRWGVSAIPLWQLITSFVLLVLSSAGMVWVAAQVFRVGMLRYGQPLRLKALGGILRPSVRSAR